MVLKDKCGSLFLSVVSIICLAVTLFSVYLLLDNKQIINENFSLKEYTVENSTEITQPSVSEESEAVETVSPENAVGKISEKTVSPYTANTSYNNIYVNNKTKQPFNISEFLKEDFNIKFSKNSTPQALIIHTHTSECYLKESRDYYTESDVTRTTDTSYNVVAVGDVIAKKLNNAGFNTLHDTTVHDTAYTGSYSRSAKTTKNYLSEYPSIKLVIDVHRDSIGSDTNKVKPVTVIQNRKAAQVMLVMCCGEGIDDFNNWRDNLKFALKFQQTMEVMYPSLARSMHYLSYKYNQNLSTPSILLEVGTDSNSIEEALTGADFAANALVAYMNTLS